MKALLVAIFHAPLRLLRRIDQRLHPKGHCRECGVELPVRDWDFGICDECWNEPGVW